jgi:2-dehydro-3-deoxygluconokinase
VDLVTLGESMALFQAFPSGPLPHAPLFTQAIAGAESNVAIALSRLGKRTRWISRLGVDPFGDLIASTLAGEGVDTSFVARDPTAPTAIFFREFKGYGEPSAYYYRSGSAASRLSPEDVKPNGFEGARHLHVTGITPALGLHTHEAVSTAMRMARDLGLTVSFDPNLRRKLWPEDRAREVLLSLLPLCDLFLPGLEEAEFLIGSHEAEAYGPAFLEMGPKIVALKLGENGSVGFHRGETIHEPPYPIERIVDPIGAGDAFAAGILSILLDEPDWTERLSLEQLQAALRRGNLLGALATQFAGDWEGLPTLAEVERIEAGQAKITR